MRRRAVIDKLRKQAKAHGLGFGVPESEIDLQVQVIAPDGFRDAVAEAERLRRESEDANRRSALALRRAVRILVDAGVSYRDAGEIMGVSHQRVAQLASAS
ncbi:hypothetical protein [uncultured Tessaracoccus sp.]|uniref:hypothetical protein n=1 Tax=uncultured Tessaracoccus sp. TaxID=905023 RepID=UPI00260040F2|nr:hypothetical protein [uncultured Tessaracoccus sp.]